MSAADFSAVDSMPLFPLLRVRSFTCSFATRGGLRHPNGKWNRHCLAPSRLFIKIQCLKYTTRRFPIWASRDTAAKFGPKSRME